MANSDRDHFKFLTPLDFIKDRKKHHVADDVEEHVFVTTSNENMARATPDEKMEKFY